MLIGTERTLNARLRLRFELRGDLGFNITLVISGRHACTHMTYAIVTFLEPDSLLLCLPRFPPVPNTSPISH